MATLAILSLVVLVAALAPLTAWPSVVHAQAATVLVKNTGKTVSNWWALGSSVQAVAQTFTTGTTTGGYTLGSVGLKFRYLTVDSSTASRITVTLNANRFGSPSNVLCTLTAPATFAARDINNFTAPTVSPCPTLAASTTYHVVVKRVNFTNQANVLVNVDVTGSDNEDTGGAPGWTIGNALLEQFVSGSTRTWHSYPAYTLMMVVNAPGVADSNSTPEFSADTFTRTLPEKSPTGTNVDGDVITATDSDSGDTLTYWLTGSAANRFEIDSNGQIKVGPGNPSFNFDRPPTSYSVTVNVSDGKDSTGAAHDAIDATTAVTINLTNVNEPPKVGGIAPITLVRRENTLTTNILYAFTASDPEHDAGDIITWWLTGVDADKFNIVRGTSDQRYGRLYFKNVLDFEMPSDDDGDNDYEFMVGVTDTAGLSHSIQVTVRVADGNDAPEITTTATTADVAENSTTVLTLAASDVDASDMQTWSVESANDGGKFEITSTGALSFKNAPDFEMPTDADRNNTYVVTVKVTDGGNLSDTHTVTVTVGDVNEAPQITTATTAVVAENSTAVLTLVATDEDASDTQTWSVDATDDGGLFEVTQGGALSFQTAPDFENKQDADADNVYEVTVRVTDAGGLSDPHTLAVTVTNINEAPQITTATTAAVAENSTAVLTLIATDVDASTTFTWSVENTGDGGKFDISSTGALTFKNAPNFEMPTDVGDTAMNNTYVVTVNVRDDGIPNNRGSINQLDDTVSVVVSVQDVNEAPVVSGHVMPEFAEIEFDVLGADLNAADYVVGTYTYEDEDRNPADTITWGLGGTDAAHFDIGSASGVLSFNIRPDFENAADMGSNNEYEIVVEADDGQGGVGTFPVVVTVTNVDETPEITTTAASHTTPSFMEIEYDAATAALVVADYDGRDEEGQTITWSRTGTDAGDFSIDSMTGVLSFTQRPNFEMPADDGSDNVYNITVRARDTASPVNVRELEVVVIITDVNERPDIDENFNPPQTYVEIEYDADTTTAGVLREVHTFTATDYDAGDTIEWALAGTDAAHLEIDAVTGVLTFRQDSCANDGPLPDFEEPCDDNADGSNTYTITVRATDDASDQKLTDYAVVVTVTNVNEVPEFTGTPDTAITLDEHDANDNYVVMDLADYDARDEEGGVTWSLTGTDRRDFAISADGVVTFAETPNYEAPEDSGGDNVYEFTVVATDVGSGSSRRNVSVAVTVTVGDVEEAGTITADNVSPAVGETVTYTLMDPDGDVDLNIGVNAGWVIQIRASGGPWQTHLVSNATSTSFTYSVVEMDTGDQLRAAVTYIDRRGSGKMAVGGETSAATANPIANAPPRLQGGTQFVAEGDAGRTVGVPITATDRDRDSLRFGIEAGEHSDKFELVVVNSTTVRLRTTEALDFETTSGVLLLTVTVHDGKDADGNAENPPVVDHMIPVAISITDVEEDGVVTLSDDEPGVAMPVTATLEDGDGGVIGPLWQWARSRNGRTGWTNISGATSASYTATQADAEFFLRATVTYTDRRGAGKGAEAITAQRVFGENQRPTFSLTEDGQRTIAENTRAGGNIGAPVAAVDPEGNRLTYTLSGMDDAAFTIVSSTGQIRVKDDLDFETKSSYSLTVEVHDGLDGLGNTSTTVDDTQAVTITVENVEEPGEVTLTTDTGTMQARVEVTAALEDGDGVTGSVDWQWARSPNGRTDWVNIAGATSAAYTPTLEEDRGNYIRATATYTDGHGPNKTAEQVSARVGDPPPVNSPPVFPPTEDGQREVAENSPTNATIGAPVAATDLNAGDSAVNDPLVYSLTGTDAASFTIDAGTGQIRLAPGIELDFEGKKTYRVTVEVTDGRDQNGDDDMDAIDDTLTVTVSVTNVNEVPVVTGDVAPSFQEGSNAPIATYTGTDPERGSLTWSVGSGGFWISSRGQLYFSSPPSYEAGQTYTVVVTATDDDATKPEPGSLVVTVTVTDVEEAGTVTIGPPRGWDGTIFTAGLDDDDGGITGETWQWQRSSNRSSWIDIDGATLASYTATEADQNQYLRVTVTYSDRRGSNKEATAAVTGRIENSTDRPTANNAPTFADASAERSVGQGTAAGRNVGAPVRATDEDAGDVLTYSLFGTDAGLFTIDPETGQIRTKDVLDYDPEGTNTHSVEVRVHDGYGPDYQSTDVGVDATITVTITVTAVAQRTTTGGGGGGGGFGPAPTAPKFVDGFRTERPLAVTARVGDAVGDPVAATHPEDLEITYALSGANASLFTVDAETGQIRLGEGATLEVGQTYTVNLTATDSTGTGAIIIVVIAVAEGVGDPYDLNRNGIIEKGEVLRAIADYFAGLIEKDAVLALVARYFAG